MSDRELRTLATRLYTLPLDLNDLSSFEWTLINCSSNGTIQETNSSDVNHHPTLPSVSEKFLLQCEPILKMLNDSYKGATKYKYETLSDEDVAFHMIRDNASTVLQQLDNIRGKKKKFVCLNDNIDHTKKDAKLIKALLVDFYESLFPIPSQFELPAEYRNRFLHVKELKDWMKEREIVRFWTQILVLVLLIVAIFTMFPDLFLFLIQVLCPLRRLFSSLHNNFSSSSSRLMTV